MVRAARLVALLLVLACAAGVAADAPAAVSAALGIFGDADAVPEVQEPAFVGTVFVPNDAGAAPRGRCCTCRAELTSGRGLLAAQRLQPSCTRRS